MEFRAKFTTPCSNCTTSTTGATIGATPIEYPHSQQTIFSNGKAAPAPEPYIEVLDNRTPAAAPIAPRTVSPATADLLDIIAEGLKGRIDLDARIDPQQLDSIRDNAGRMLDLIETLSGKIAALEARRPTSIELRGAIEPIVIDGAHKQMPLLAALASRRHNIYLWDSTGGGKSHAVKQLAPALGLKYHAQVFNRQSPAYLLIGYCGADGTYFPTAFYNCFKHGGVYVGEELDNASAELLVTLDLALDKNGIMTFPNGETVQRHPDFIFIACGNTAGRGASPRYPERKSFDAAFSNRFSFVRWQYDAALEETIALQINPAGQRYIDWTRAARRAAAELTLRLEITPRTTFTLCELALEPQVDDETLIHIVMAGIDQPSIDKLLASTPFPERN